MAELDVTELVTAVILSGLVLGFLSGVISSGR